MPGGRPTKQIKLAIEARRVRVAELYLHGEICSQIAAKESCDTSTIARDIKAIRKEWREVRVDYMQDIIEVELARINRLQVEYWNAWVRSCQVADKANTKTVREGIRFLDDGKTQVQDERTEEGTTKEWQGGNPAFLEGYRWCIDRKLKLFGKDAAPKAPLNPDGTPWTPAMVDKLEPQELLMINGIYERLVQTPVNGNGLGGHSEAGLN